MGIVSLHYSRQGASIYMVSVARSSCLCALWLFLPIMLSGQNLSPSNTLRPVSQVNRISPNADVSTRAPLVGHVPRWATTPNLVAASVDPAAELRLTILLRRSSAAQQAFAQLLADQQTPGSPLYHQWISPMETGALFGPTESDVQKISSWLQSVGFIVRAIAPSRMTIEISGSVETAAQAFQTTFSLYRAGSKALRAPNAEPLLPSALLPVVQFVSGLAEHHPVPSGGFDGPNAHPSLTAYNGAHYITPADFATIYDLTPLLTTNTGATVSGKPQHVAIIAVSDVDPVDIQEFATSIGSSSYNFTPFYADGVDPGYTAGQGEATGDLERVLGTAPGVSADLVIGGVANELTALYDSMSYAVNTLQDPVITMSFHDCEADLGQGEIDTVDSLWSTAAANGVSVFVSAGDAGAAGCDAHGTPAPATQSLNTNGLCSSPYNTCVGGTEFNDTANPSAYWSSTNTPATYGSALSYIPEGSWNDPEETVNGATEYIVFAGGGGSSQFVPKPSWQTGPGVPADGFRDTPDISFSASPLHDSYWGCQAACGGGGGGTSASTPSMAAIAALLNTAAGKAQGNLNPLIYRLADSPAASSIFHDATVATSGMMNCTVSVPSMCNNSTPGPSSLTGGLAGYLLTPGYDLATGWGSLDVANFIRAAVPVTTTLALTTNATQIAATQSFTATTTLTAAANSVALPTGTVQYESNGVALGSPVVLMNDSASSTLSLSTPGTYALTASYSGDDFYTASNSSTVQVIVTATPPSFTLSPASSSLTFASGATTANSDSIGLTSASGFVGSVALSCSISSGMAAFPPACVISPASSTLAANGTATATVTITSTAPQPSAVFPFAPHSARLLPAGVGVAAALLFGFGLLLPGQRRRKWLPMVVIAFLGLLQLVEGCGSGPSTPPRSSAGFYTVTVTGNGMSSGALSASTASTTFSVTIH
jgi:subtilase family serine protease